MTHPVQAGSLAVHFRPVSSADAEFLYQVYASTRTEEVAVVPWSDAQKEHFLRQQFHAQDVSYRARENPESSLEFLILMADGMDAGRIYLERGKDAIHILDISLLPRFRGNGIGTAVLQAVLDEGKEGGRNVSIHVEFFNRARRLYDRLGFQQVSSDQVYLLMEWRPNESNPAKLEGRDA